LEIQPAKDTKRTIPFRAAIPFLLPGFLGLRGPIAGGGQVVINVTKPNGQPWLSLPVEKELLASDLRLTLKKK
jgi:hypothetical protein